MLGEIGYVEAIFRYPVKSMAGERLEVADLGWHGLDGDRRLAFRRVDDRGGRPWLSATTLPDLHGIFDEGTLSVIASETVDEIGRLAGRTLDVRRFRPNVVVKLWHAAANVPRLSKVLEPHRSLWAFSVGDEVSAP